MVGPDQFGKGGVSRVVSIWRDADFFDDYVLKYVASSSDTSRHKIVMLFKGLFRFVMSINGASLVYIHSSAFTSFYRKSIFLLMTKFLGKKVILHIHPSGFSDFYNGLSGVELKYATFVLRQVDSFVVLTEEMRRYIATLFPHKPVHVLRNAINLQAMRNRYNIQRKEGKLLYLGWYIRAKGVFELVDAIERLRGEGCSAHLSLFGTKEINRMRDYVQTKGLSDAISVNGWIDDEEKLRVLYECSILILPSHSEGIPNVILEAMATRTPIIATFVGGMKEVLRDEENALIVAIKNPADLSEKITRLLKDKELSVRLAENAYKQAQEHYDVSVIRSQFRDIIRQTDK